jgi:ABC-type branched-subunit amino acid transport system ATPase component
MNQGEVLMAGSPDEVRADRRVQEVYTGKGTPPLQGKAAGAGPARAPLLVFGGVNAFYGKSHILNDATLDVRDGEIVALLGRNGAGKSTLLKTIAGLVRAASGRIEFGGRDIAALPAPGGDDPAPALDRLLQEVRALDGKWRQRDQVISNVVQGAQPAGA